MIKAFFFCASIAFVLPNISAQADSVAIQLRVEAYFAATEKKDWLAVMDMIYPKLFNYISKENMAEVFTDLESQGMAMEMRDFEILGISNTMGHEGEKFALLTYKVGMTIRFTSQEYRDSTMQVALKNSFEATYGAQNITHNPTTFSFDIHASRSMFAIASEGSDDWFFVENDPSQPALTGMLIPEEVRNRLAPLDKRN